MEKYSGILETIKPDEFSEILNYGIKTKMPIFVEGKTGIGKSRIVQETVKEKDIDLVDIRAILKDIGDLVMRIPDTENGKKEMIEYVTDELPRDGEGVIFLDEFKQAPMEIRRMFYQLILDRELGASYRLPDGWMIVSASNLDEEVQQEELEAPLFDRFVLRVRLVNSFDDWKKWAFNHNINQTIITFIKHFGKFQEEDNRGRALMTPRRWEWISNALDNNASDAVFRAMMPAGISGEFLAYKKQVDMFKDIPAYLNGKKEIPEEMGKQFALSTAIVNSVRDNESLKSILNSEIDLNEECKVYMILGSIKKHRFETGNADVDKLTFMNRLPNDLKAKLIETYGKYNWVKKLS